MRISRAVRESGMNTIVHAVAGGEGSIDCNQCVILQETLLLYKVHR
jgi:hypothetical protein